MRSVGKDVQRCLQFFLSKDLCLDLTATVGARRACARAAQGGAAGPDGASKRDTPECAHHSGDFER